MGPLSFHRSSGPCPEAHPRRRPRRCLLKGCERWFIPTCPQSRYCCHHCAEAARRWRRVKASRRYRATDYGRQQRRQQHRHYRQRRRHQPSAAATQPTSETREGKRPTPAGENFCQRMCDRPGGYATFPLRPQRSYYCFCSLACRLALRRVLQREERYQQRRRRGRRHHVKRRRPRRDTS